MIIHVYFESAPTPTSTPADVVLARFLSLYGMNTVLPQIYKSGTGP